MIDRLLGMLAARFWRWRIKRDRGVIEAGASSYVRCWMEINPARCMYCAYTRWANAERGARLKYGEHDCVEVCGGLREMPSARVVLR